MKKKIFATVALLCACVMLSGCITAIKHGYIITQKTRFFGLEVQPGSSGSVPSVKLGFGTEVVMFVPTSTNSTVNVPRYADTFSMDQSLNPFNWGVVENAAFGDVAIGTNNTSSAIIPKGPRLPVFMPIPGVTDNTNQLSK